MKDIIIGQECICPDGLGRVADIIEGVAGAYRIKVDTYIKNRGCEWDSNNITLIPIPTLELFDDSSKLTIKPRAYKNIDLDKMIDSDIDMEFNDENKGYWFIGYGLMEIKDNCYINKHGVMYEHCRIRQDHWHISEGNNCPIPDGLIIEYKYLRSGTVRINTTSNYLSLNWNTIIAFKVIDCAENCKY